MSPQHGPAAVRRTAATCQELDRPASASQESGVKASVGAAQTESPCRAQSSQGPEQGSDQTVFQSRPRAQAGDTPVSSTPAG